MPTPKKPQDRKPKTTDPAESFTFEHGGKSHTFKPTVEHITPGFLRKNRKLNDMDAVFEIFEVLADEEQLEVIDNLSHEEFGQLVKDFYAHLGALRGE